MPLFALFRLFSVALVIFGSGCSTLVDTPCRSQVKQLHLTIVHTNDNHGRFWKNARGELGMAARKTLIDGIRKEVEMEGGKVLVLSAGDINTGVPESDIQDAKPDFEGMNLIGYDAMTIGNHEFDNPLATLRQQQKWAKFPFVSANIYDRSTGKRLFDPWEIFRIDGVNVAVMGLTTEDTAVQSNREYTEGFYFEEAVDAARKLVPVLKDKHKADIVIGLTHIGHYLDARHEGNAPGDVTVAEDVDGIDIVVGGHSQTRLLRPDIKNSTYILQAWEWGKYVGRADFTYTYIDNFDGKGHRKGVLKMNNYRLIPVNLKKPVVVDGKKQWVTIDKEIPEDPVVLAKLKPYQDKASKLLDKRIGWLDQTMPGDRALVRARSAAIGNLLAHAQMEKAGADLAVLNGGGIRTGLKAGNITEKNILEVQPFGNMVSYVVFTGRELKNYIEDIASIKPVSGGFAHFANVKLVMEGDKLIKLEVGGKPVQMDKKYKVAVNAFSASGGDNWPDIDETPSYVNTGYTDAVALKEYISKHSPLKLSSFQPRGEVSRK